MIEVRVGELAEEPAEAVVRPVGSDFSPVTPATRRLDAALGPEVREQCSRLGDLPLGSAVITSAGGLPADYLVHVAVRSPAENPTPAIVRTGLLNALRRLSDWGIGAVVLPPLGTGAGNLDAEESAHAMIPVLLAHMAESGTPRAVTLVVDDAYQETVFSAALDRHRDLYRERSGGERVGGERVGDGP